jgi:hypothetical protein
LTTEWPSSSLLPAAQYRAAAGIATAATAGAAACGAQLLWPGSHAAVLAAVVILTTYQVGSLRRLTGDVIPFAAIVVLVLNTVGLSGYYFFSAVDNGRSVGANLQADSHAYRVAATTFAIASVCTWAGALLVSRPADRKAVPALPELGSRGRGVIVMSAIVPLVTCVAGRGVHALVHRTGYLSAAGPAELVKLGTLLLPAGLAATGLLVFDRQRAFPRLGITLLSAYAVLYFALGTRGIGLTPPLLVISAMVAGRRVGWKWITASLLASCLLFQLPLALRGNATTEAGLGPWASRLIADPGAAVIASPKTAVGNVLFSVPLTGVVATDGRFTPAAFLTSVNPLPGDLTDWPQIKEDLRINGYVPYSGLGELASLGFAYLIGFFLLVGAGLTLVQRSLRSSGGLRAIVGFMGGAGLTLNFAVGMLQYNTRADVRFLWCLAVLALVFKVWPPPKREPGSGHA